MSNTKELTVRAYGKDEPLAPLKRFWYDIYVTEMGRDFDKANHALKELDDPRAHHGELIVAHRGDTVVGTLICTPSWTNALGEYEALYDLKRFGAKHPQNTGIITKLMVAPEYRNSRLSVGIACELYRHAVPSGVHHAFIDCNDHLVPFFRRLGFTEWSPAVQHCDYGKVHVLKLDCLDLARLKKLRSPLYMVAASVAPQLKTPAPTTLSYGTTT